VASLERPAPTPAQAPAHGVTPARFSASGAARTHDALLLATATDELGTGGCGHSQSELAQVLAERILSGQILCCPDSVAPTREEQAAKALRLFEAVRVRSRGSRHPPVRARARPRAARAPCTCSHAAAPPRGRCGRARGLSRALRKQNARAVLRFCPGTAGSRVACAPARARPSTP
jgi:hypothetical protein